MTISIVKYIFEEPLTVLVSCLPEPIWCRLFDLNEVYIVNFDIKNIVVPPQAGSKELAWGLIY